VTSRRNALIRRLAAVAVVTLGLACVPGMPSASAAGATCGAYGNWFRGYLHDPGAHSEVFEGASSYITFVPSAICGSDSNGPAPSTRFLGTNFTTTWVMIADYTRVNYSQDGYMTGYGSAAYPWAEFVNHSAGKKYDRWLAGSVGSGTRMAFTERWASGCVCIESRANGVLITQTNYNPFYVWNDAPDGSPKWSPTYSSEKSHQESDILGEVTNKAKFDGMGVQYTSDNSVHYTPCTLSTLYPIASRSGLSGSGCTSFQTWTT